MIDNGHGAETPGKRSPDGRLREYRYAREIASAVVARLKSLGYDAVRIVTEENDVPLAERCRRVNAFCSKLGKGNVLLVSVHCDASGHGDWMQARGWSAYTSRGRTAGDRLADCLYKAAERHFPGMKIRKDTSDGDPDIEAGFYILKHTQCAAVLTENFFQDNRQDVAFMLSQVGRDAIVDTHVDGITDYIRGAR